MHKRAFIIYNAQRYDTMVLYVNLNGNKLVTCGINC